MGRSRCVKQWVGGKWLAVLLLKCRDCRNFFVWRFDGEAVYSSYTRIEGICASIMALLKQAVNFCGATWSLC